MHDVIGVAKASVPAERFHWNRYKRETCSLLICVDASNMPPTPPVVSVRPREGPARRFDDAKHETLEKRFFLFLTL